MEAGHRHLMQEGLEVADQEMRPVGGEEIQGAVQNSRGWQGLVQEPGTE